MVPQFSDCGLLIIDMQEKLLDTIPEDVREQLLKNVEILIELAKDLDASIFYTEQYPRGLGPTHPRLKEKLLKTDAIRVEKVAFSCLAESDFCLKVTPHLPQSLIVVGLEAHICVLMTCLDILADDEQDYRDIYVPQDCTASRKKANWKNALSQLQELGVFVTNTETIVYEALEEAGTDMFKKYSKMLR